MSKQRIPLEEMLAHLPLFGSLDGKQRRQVCAGLTEVDAPRGSVLFLRGEPCHGLHVVVWAR